jgi:hypothetical protein
VSAVLPAGFEAYVRILHPVREPATGDGVVRWAEVAAWSGLPLRGDAQFHSIALPRQRPAQPAPWSGQGPEPGSLYPPDAAVLVSILRGWTATPDQCWFCLWDGYGYGSGRPFAVLQATRDPAGEDLPDEDLPDEEDSREDDPPEEAGMLPELFQDPVPGSVRQGPRVELPDREHLLYAGPVEAAVGAGGPLYAGQSANLWWPQDHAWCVASEIDLPWTYVGGPAALIDRIVADQRIETLRAAPADPVGEVEEWIGDAAAGAAEQLFTSGEAAITTALGTIRAYLDLPSWHRKGMLRTESVDGGDGGGGGGGGGGFSQTPLSRRSTRDELRDEVVHHLIFDVLSLVES